jgi:hypothetical protein
LINFYYFLEGNLLAMVLWDVMPVSFGCDVKGDTQLEGERDGSQSDCHLKTD